MEIKLEKIISGYSSEYLKDIDISFSSNDWIFFIGETGSGKSTLLQTIAYLTKIFQGKYYFNGKELGNKESLKEFRDKIGVMFQYTEKQFFCNIYLYVYLTIVSY